MCYILDTTIHLPKKATHPFIKELLFNYTPGKDWNVLYDAEENSITVGDFEKAASENGEYVVNVTAGGVYIKGLNYSALMRGFMTFLNRIKCLDPGVFALDICSLREKPLINFRAVHLCIFPETKLDFFRKCVRSCAISKYSHIVFEFWGMLKYDCMQELAWPFAFSKAQIKEIVAEANALGVEIIPMFNHLGHASACREIHGKHVVLDQNPTLSYMFDSYGWIWNFKREDVYTLLRKIREELIDVCGDGKWFHLGCDEAYAIGKSEQSALEMAEYLNKVSAELKENGRRGIIWHDMLLPQNEFDSYYAYSDKAVSEILLNKLDKNLLLADWQYTVHNELWKTSEALKSRGFDVVCCPWHNPKNIHEALDTVTTHNLFGVMHTTWNTLQHGFKEMVYGGVIYYGADRNDVDIQRFYCASVARVAMPSNGKYEKSGWVETSTGPGL
ncbi:MAG: family 20 glycosylhydrolase [Clostridia bacterium]|nr:family 20 glycosylhydrolase [Clostridia bacterium]